MEYGKGLESYKSRNKMHGKADAMDHKHSIPKDSWKLTPRSALPIRGQAQENESKQDGEES